YRRMKMSHLIADSQKELLEFVDKIGVKRKWIQEMDTPREHFDICISKRQKAVELGAIEIDMRELARMTTNRKHNSENENINCK
ncbi:MAG TPA: DUF4031 domain-containing protein, partial [Flavobacteriaceae bacterium]|nr:DUF4031 domain-containing protein [Flavobacteriaceae bacterium]